MSVCPVVSSQKQQLISLQLLSLLLLLLSLFLLLPLANTSPLLCAWYSSMHFTQSNTFNPHKSPQNEEGLFSPLLRKLRCARWIFPCHTASKEESLDFYTTLYPAFCQHHHYHCYHRHRYRHHQNHPHLKLKSLT